VPENFLIGWRITGGTITGGQGTTLITYMATGDGPVTLGLQLTNPRTGCASEWCSVVIEVNPLPACNIRAEEAICAGTEHQAQARMADGSEVPEGFLIGWRIAGGEITGGQGTTLITYTPLEGSEKVTLGLQLTDETGCVSEWCSVEIAVNPLPECNIRAEEEICAGTERQAQAINVPEGFGIGWRIAGGEITGGDGTSLITYVAYGGGPLTLGLQITDPDTRCVSEWCSTEINVLPPLEATGLRVENADPTTGEVCLAMELNGGSGDYITKWEPVAFELDESSGLWCGKLPPCESTLVKVEVTCTVTGCAPVMEKVLVNLECPAHVPTLNQWGLILFGLLLAATGAWYLLRKHKTA
jgi:hypothetical protein